MLHIVLCSRIPDSVGKDIEKACQSIYPLHDVYVRKVKMLKKPKFECKWYTAMKLARTLNFFFSSYLWEHMMTNCFGPRWSPDYYLLRSADLPSQEVKKKNCSR